MVSELNVNELRIPGSFVVLQGVAGDGLINTMDHLPCLVERTPDDFQQSSGISRSSSVPLNVIGSSLQRQGLFPSAPPSVNSDLANLAARRSDPAAGFDGSFIVVQDKEEKDAEEEEEEESRKSPRRCYQTCSPQQPHNSSSAEEEERPASSAEHTPESSSTQDEWEKEALQRWELECQEKQAQGYIEWQETCHANRRVAGHNSNSQDFWWLSEGQLAVLDALPTKETKPQKLKRLSPGTVLMATALFTLDSTDFTPIQADNIQAEGVLPTGREGWLQILQTEEGTYVVQSRNGYSFCGPGLPSQYTDPLRWIWRVTCVDGAFIREGLELSTLHICTIPYGSLIHVLSKTVNSMGLSRLHVTAVLPDNVPVEGWCSEFLNPLSGQRGSILQPLPFCVPATYRVSLRSCAVIRNGIELSSPEIGFAPSGALLTVVGRTFSEHPSDRCIERLWLAGDGGWISLRLNKAPPHNTLIVEQVGVDSSFDPNRAGAFHLQSLKRVQEQQELREIEAANASPPTISSVEDDNSSSSASSSLNSCFITAVPPASPTCTYTRTVSCKSLRSDKMESVRPTESPKCLICLSEERTATIVHSGTGHIACCLMCARILKARGDPCPVCRQGIEQVIQHFWA